MSDTTTAFDPGAYTVAEVEDYVTANPDERDAVLAAEEAGKNRVTLLDWLSSEPGVETQAGVDLQAIGYVPPGYPPGSDVGPPVLVTVTGSPQTITPTPTNVSIAGGSNAPFSPAPTNVSIAGGSSSWESGAASTMTLSSIAPTTAVHGAANTTVTCTGTNFNTRCVAAVDGVPQDTTYVSATSMTFVLKTSTYANAATVQVTVLDGAAKSTQKPFVLT